jgi:probable HAF family extracellular repeat protein
LATAPQAQAQGKADRKTELSHYKVKDLGTLGGSFSISFGVNNAGDAGGAANVPGEYQHAFLWRRGHMYDLGTLGGFNSNSGAPNGQDELAIVSETSSPDPLGENFCAYGTGLTCLAAIWREGGLHPLPTLGGSNGQGYNVNDRGKVAGVSEIGTHDSKCPWPQVLDFEATVWDADGHAHELRPLPGDTVGFALNMNNRGQVAGSTGTCDNTALFPLQVGPHAVLWDNGKPIDLGSLGGAMVSTAAVVNNLGVVVGASDLPGDNAIHSFMWTKEGGMKDLGTVGTDSSSFAAGLNDAGQVVGGSCEPNLSGNCRAYLWQDGQMVDLNTLIEGNTSLYLIQAMGLSNSGDIVGLAFDSNSGQPHAFLATPID